MFNIVLFGAPGAGKGTQALLLAEKFDLIHLSTGDMLRNEIASGSRLGQQAQNIISKGELVSDELVINMIRERIERHPDAKGFIFDGFPRTQAQARELDRLLQEKDMKVAAMVALEVDPAELTCRLMKRGESSGRPDDNSIEIIGNRIEVYNRKTTPVIEYYRAQEKYHPVDGLGHIKDVSQRLNKLTESLLSQSVAG
ncbi:MAG: adenylate kinase [Bacteroidales bacterium]|jgi:adenylate kinase|nr:adenylate kinase [Bacteroidales bacterium]